MSIAMLQDPFKVHDILDDLEATFWAYLLGVVKHFAGNITFSLNDLFYQDYKEIDGTPHRIGGRAKRGLLESGELLSWPGRRVQTGAIQLSMRRTRPGV